MDNILLVKILVQTTYIAQLINIPTKTLILSIRIKEVAKIKNLKKYLVEKKQDQNLKRRLDLLKNPPMDLQANLLKNLALRVNLLKNPQVNHPMAEIPNPSLAVPNTLVSILIMGYLVHKLVNIQASIHITQITISGKTTKHLEVDPKVKNQDPNLNLAVNLHLKPEIIHRLNPNQLEKALNREAHQNIVIKDHLALTAITNGVLFKDQPINFIILKSYNLPTLCKIGIEIIKIAIAGKLVIVNKMVTTMIGKTAITDIIVGQMGKVVHLMVNKTNGIIIMDKIVGITGSKIVGATDNKTN